MGPVLVDFTRGRVYKPGDPQYERTLAIMRGNALATRAACLGATPPQRDTA
jgi:hypothetical protein